MRYLEEIESFFHLAAKSLTKLGVRFIYAPKRFSVISLNVKCITYRRNNRSLMLLNTCSPEIGKCDP